MEALTSILFHGLAYAMILYIISVGLSVTMGLMGFVNLAHGVFAMAGGYVTVTLMNTYAVPFALAVLVLFGLALGPNLHLLAYLGQTPADVINLHIPLISFVPWIRPDFAYQKMFIPT